MGLFSSRYRLTAGLQVSKVFEDPHPNLLDKELLESVLENYPLSVSPKFTKSSITEGILSAFVNNFNGQGEKYYYYGATEHPDGVPEGLYAVNPFALDEQFYNERILLIENILNEIYQRTTQVIEYRYRPAQAYVYYNIAIQEAAGITVHNRFDSVSTTNRAFAFTIGQEDNGNTGLSGRITPLNFNSTVEVGDTFKLAPVTYYIDVNDNVVEKEALTLLPANGQVYLDKIRITDQRTGEYEVIDTGFAFDTQQVNENVGLRHQVFFYFTDTLEHFYWVYDQADATYPELYIDPADYEYEADTLYPIAYIANKNDEQPKFTYLGQLGAGYKEKTEVLLKKIGINLENVHEILIPDGEQDPNYNKIEDCHISFQADLNTTNQAELSYIYEYLRLAYLRVNIAGIGFLSKTETHYQWDELQVFIRTGNVDTYNTVPTLDVNHTNIGNFDTNHDGIITKSNGVEIGKIKTDVIKGSVTGTLEVDYTLSQDIYEDGLYIMRKQISETQLVEIVIKNFHRTDTFRERTQGDNVGGLGIVYNDMGTIANGTCTIFISTTAMKAFNSLVKSEILYSSLLFTVRSTDAIEIKWWQEQSLWEFIGFFITTITLGAGAGAAGITARKAGESVLLAIIKDIISQLVINRIIVEAFKVIVEVIGVEAALYLAVIIAAYSGTMGEEEELFKLLTAEELMLSATSMISATNLVTNDRMLELTKEIEAYEESYADQLDQLAAIKEQLNLNTPELTGEDIYQITRGRHIPSLHQTPTEYINESIHMCNPGVLCLDNQDTYVERLLTLPTRV